MLMYESAEQNTKNNLLDFSIAIRMGFNAGEKEWKEFVKFLKPKSSKRQEKVLISLTPEKLKAVRRLLKHGS